MESRKRRRIKVWIEDNDNKDLETPFNLERENKKLQEALQELEKRYQYLESQTQQSMHIIRKLFGHANEVVDFANKFAARSEESWRQVFQNEIETLEWE